MTGVETTIIFIMRKLAQKYLTKRTNLQLTFMDLEKPFDRVPEKVI